jgi:hypothetical protein
VDLDGDGLPVDADESGTADRGEHDDLRTHETATWGGPDRGNLDGAADVRAGV